MCCHDTNTPLVTTRKEGDLACGKGPVLTFAPAVHNKLLRQVRDVADAKNSCAAISFQQVYGYRHRRLCLYRWGHTFCVDFVAASVHAHHGRNGTQNDIENVIKLIYETLLSIKAGQSFKYFDKI